MTITIIVVFLVILILFYPAWDLGDIGDNVSSNEELLLKIRRKLKSLRIWFWITFVLGLLLFIMSLVYQIKNPSSLELWPSLLTFFILAILLFFIPSFLFICIKRQKKQLLKVNFTLEQLKGSDNETNNKNDNNQEKEFDDQMNFVKNHEELICWQNQYLSDIIGDILICKEEYNIVWCYFNKKNYVNKIQLAINGYAPCCNFGIEWLHTKCDYIRKGEDLCKIKSEDFRILSGESTKKIKAPSSGYYFSFFNSYLPDESLERGDVFCAFFESIEYLIEKSNFNVIEVLKDDFSNDIIVRGKVIAGFLDWCEIGIIKVNFENRMGEYSLLVRYTRKNVYIRKNDTIMFLFEDGRSISLKALSAPISCNNFYEDSIIRYRLKSEQIKMFKELSLVKWQIRSYDGEKLAEGTFSQCGKHFNEIFKSFIAKFENEVVRNISEDILQRAQQGGETSSGGKSSSSCFVYLMKDTANNYHKIGISSKPEYREKTLQSEKPSIELICCKEFPTRKMARALESALHSTYSEKHVRGEWFKLDEDDVAEIVKSLS